MTAPVLVTERNRIPHRNLDIVKKQLALGQRPLAEFLQRFAVGDTRKVKRHDDFHTMRVPVGVEESITVIGDDGQDRDLRDSAVGDPCRTLTVDDDVTAADLRGQIAFIPLRGTRMTFLWVKHRAV